MEQVFSDFGRYHRLDCNYGAERSSKESFYLASINRLMT
jgi:hypothetical protein